VRPNPRLDQLDTLHLPPPKGASTRENGQLLQRVLSAQRQATVIHVHPHEHQLITQSMIQPMCIGKHPVVKLETQHTAKCRNGGLSLVVIGMVAAGTTEGCHLIISAVERNEHLEKPASGDPCQTALKGANNKRQRHEVKYIVFDLVTGAGKRGPPSVPGATSSANCNISSIPTRWGLSRNRLAMALIPPLASDG
jgi:hypothetical protein